MKTTTKENNLKKTRTKIQFVRVFSFYVELAISPKKSEPYYFKVTAATEAPLNRKTGMTVDLIQLNLVAGKVFKNQRAKCASAEDFFKLKFVTFRISLAKKKISLRSLQFDECRGLSVLIDDHGLQTTRHDFATDDAGKIYADKSFEITGRLENSDIRGCSLMVE